MIYYLYEYTNQRQPVATFLVEDEKVWVAVCSEKDQFCKKTGRNIVYGRQKKYPNGYMPPLNNDRVVWQGFWEERLKDAVEDFAHHLVTNGVIQDEMIEMPF
jgi:hypothetical protein